MGPLTLASRDTKPKTPTADAAVKRRRGAISFNARLLFPLSPTKNSRNERERNKKERKVEEEEMDHGRPPALHRREGSPLDPGTRRVFPTLRPRPPPPYRPPPDPIPPHQGTGSATTSSSTAKILPTSSPAAPRASAALSDAPPPLPPPPRPRDPGHLHGDPEQAARGARPGAEHFSAAGEAAVREGGSQVREFGGASEAVQDLKVGLLVSGTVGGSGEQETAVFGLLWKEWMECFNEESRDWILEDWSVNPISPGNRNGCLFAIHNSCK
ncbi:formin-like protein 5 isoform X2 [Phoenix dactylifera]|uniref:Formin-like protein 5 isoform X2 n=1 Tax=Phoenix dactylifera TaxID=42345 RepID=A0A8B9ARV5_PHODC|nr:formin-like protein 5 isoform X2 [Phoenix dactylifera]